MLSGPQVTLKPAQPERTGVVTQADYLGRTLTLDKSWPEAALGSAVAPLSLANRVFEIGVPGRMTSYTLAKAEPAGPGTRLTLTEGAAFYLSEVSAVDAVKRQVECVLSPSNVSKENPTPVPGQDKHWVAGNEAGTRAWRADFLGQDAESGRFLFQLDGAVTEADFGKHGKLRLWEYGVGDTARMPTFASLRRVADNEYDLSADVDVDVAFAGGPTRKVTAAELARNGGVVRLKSK